MAKNLTGEKYVPYSSNFYFFLLTNRESLPAAQGGLGIPRDLSRVSYAAPRTFGVTITLDF